MSTEAPVDLRDLSDALEENDAPHAPDPGAAAHGAVPEATTPAAAPYAAQLEQLASMFPDTPRATLEQILVRHHGHMEAAIPAALEVSDPAFTPTAADRAMQRLAAQPPDAGQGPFPVAQAYPPPTPARPTAPAQQWDPSQLRYSPRVVRGRGDRSHIAAQLPAADAAQPPVPPRPASYAAHAYGVPVDDGVPVDAKKLQEDLKRMTESGLAKVSSTWSTLRQKAQHAMRNLEQEGRLRTPREATAPRTAREWTTAPPTWGAAYDQDPEPVHDTQLDRLMHGDAAPAAGAAARPAPPPKPAAPRAQAPRWGQRYAQAPPSAAVSRAQATGTPLSWADVGVDDDEAAAPTQRAHTAKADAVKADAERQMRAKATQPAEPTAAGRSPKGKQPMDTDGAGPAQEPARGPEGGAEAPAPPAEAPAARAEAPAAAAEPATDTDDDDYVHNPFDDDD
ncbi:hypothetical protein MBRA1_003659 [Malassezia brasiliensis]|uniref:CUE domain-containing protein n=1 Tax=Malassezia brasiliensis TaxID=1821822 RepID=A0AAF0IUI8_9BASI|nr:hypothetical protein MBRA1_003659 [Malassezia brasiliensis]